MGLESKIKNKNNIIKEESAENLILSIIEYDGNTHISTFENKIKNELKNNSKYFGKEELFYAIHEYYKKRSLKEFKKIENDEINNLHPMWENFIEYGVSIGEIPKKKLYIIKEKTNNNNLKYNSDYHKLLEKGVSLYLG